MIGRFASRFLSPSLQGNPMVMLIRLLVVACLVLPFTACKKEEAPKVEAQAAIPLPTSSEQKDWKPYLEYKPVSYTHLDVYKRQIEGHRPEQAKPKRKRSAAMLILPRKPKFGRL